MDNPSGIRHHLTYVGGSRRIICHLFVNWLPTDSCPSKVKSYRIEIIAFLPFSSPNCLCFRPMPSLSPCLCHPYPVPMLSSSSRCALRPCHPYPVSMLSSSSSWPPCPPSPTCARRPRVSICVPQLVLAVPIAELLPLLQPGFLPLALAHGRHPCR